MLIRILFVIFLLGVNAVFSGTGTLQAQELISAKVLSIEGQVEIRRSTGNQLQARKIAFKVEDKLTAGDTIVTGRNGRLVLGLSDGSQAVIASQTTVVIQNLTQSPRTLFNVLRGKTRIHIEKLGGQPNPYRVNTPTAVIAVRGTVFDVLVGENETQVFLHEGEVAVTNMRLPNQPVLLSAGQMTRIMVQSLPNPPSAFKAGRNDGMFKTGHSGETFQDNRRIADRGARPEGTRVDGRSNPNPGRRESSDPRPNLGRGGTPALGGGIPDQGRGGSRPNSNPSSTGRRP